jgi:hypothetical protein
MRRRSFSFFISAVLCALFTGGASFPAAAQGAKHKEAETPTADSDADHVEQRAAWFSHGRVIPGKSAAELRYRAFKAKLQLRAAHTAHTYASSASVRQQASSAGAWTPLGPVPLASDATGSGLQDYRQVSGRATAVAIDPADPTGNTVFIGGAQGGVWKSTNAAASDPTAVTWTPLTDDQPTLASGAIAIQPGNSNPAQSVILVGTGEANNSGDSYFGLGILRSTDGGNTWSMTNTANNGGNTVSFSGLGGARMAFSTTSGQTNTVVAAMAATSEGIIDGSLTSSTLRGLYTSTDAGQTWAYDSLSSGGASEATSATSVAYNAAAGLFFAAVRYQGFFSSSDGLNWTRLTNQPGGSLLSATACPQNFVSTCPIYRGEITVVPGRNEMYVWFVSLSSGGEPVDEGIWQSLNGGASWTQINDSGITNCGDNFGCGVSQGTYNLELLAVPNCPGGQQTCTGNPTDLYAGAINLYKCSMAISSGAACNAGFLNLTHVYGCSPIAALAHVHPDQHALAYAIPTAGAEATADLMYFANDGGIYRALNGFAGLTTGSCTGTNAFDDLNQNLGSMTQFVSFSEHPSDPNTLLGGTQDNGSPATASATTSTSWINVVGGDGGYNAIDPNSPLTWFASNPDIPPGGLNILECGSGVACDDSSFTAVVSSSEIGGDDGAFYFPYILDPQSTTTLLVGTCRIWSGPRLGGTYSLLSLNFDTLGTGTCSGSEVNLVRAIAAGGLTNSNGSQVIYATTDGLGPTDGSSPIGGNVWVTTNAVAVSGGSSTFANVTGNGPSGSINPNQFPISSVAVDTSDPSGNTAYVTVMGFTGGPGHVWQTTNAGATWADFSGSNTGALPDSPVNAVVVDPVAHVVYVGTDVGVFQSSTLSPSWGEVGPSTGGGFLPNVAVTALGLFNSNGQKLLRASTYGRGVWQTDLMPGFAITVSNARQSVFVGQPVTFNGTLVSEGGYSNSVELSCVNNPPASCQPSPVSLTPTTTGAPFTVSVGGGLAVGNYSFGVQGAGSDPNNTTNVANLTIQVVNFGLTTPAPASISVPRGTTSSPVSFQLATQGTFTQTVTLSCAFTPAISNASCNFTPGATLSPPYPPSISATVTVPAATATGNYTVTLQAATAGIAPVTASFGATVTTNPNFSLSEPSPFPNVNQGSTTTSGPITITALDGFAGTVNLLCPTTCSLNPTSVSSFPSTVTLTIDATGLPLGSNQLTMQGISGIITQRLTIPFMIGTYTTSGQQTFSTTPGAGIQANVTFTSVDGYSGQILAGCDPSALPGTQCSLGPTNLITLNAGGTAGLTATINVPTNAAAGIYNIKINTQDTSGTPTNTFTVQVTIQQDYSLGDFSPTSATINAGGSASYNFSVLPVGAAYNGSITLNCSIFPTFAGSCAFNPAVATTSSGNVVMTVQTQSGGMAPLRGKRFPAVSLLALALPGIVLLRRKSRRRGASFLFGLILVLAAFVLSCGGGQNGGGGSTGSGGTTLTTYTITVTGTPASISQPNGAQVTLIVQ